MMRLSTSSMYGLGLSAMLKQQSDFTNVAQQLASGKRVVSPSDDPRAATQALGVSQAIAVSEQYASSRTTAKQSLEMEEGVLQNVTDALQSLSPLIVQAGNGTLSDSDRESLATQIDGLNQQMLGLANSQDGNGNYIFSGMKGDTQPFQTDATDSTKVSYQGAEKLQMEQRVDASRQMTTGDLGSQVFEDNLSGETGSNIFNTLADFVAALKAPQENDDSAKASFNTALSTASQRVSQSLDNVLTVRASIGSKLNELDALDVTGDSRVLNYKSTLSDLQDLDYASAISDYTLKQVSLQAAQKTFTQIQGMSLFDLL